jgi:ribosomal protein L37E
MPNNRQRYRCSQCGNSTGFYVTKTIRVREFYHYNLGGRLVVEGSEALAEHVKAVECRWCGHGRSVELIDATDIDP